MNVLLIGFVVRFGCFVLLLLLLGVMVWLGVVFVEDLFGLLVCCVVLEVLNCVEIVIVVVCVGLVVFGVVGEG